MTWAKSACEVQNQWHESGRIVDCIHHKTHMVIVNAGPRGHCLTIKGIQMVDMHTLWIVCEWMDNGNLLI